MPAGGTWTAQNKRRPGVYINFVSVPKPIGLLGDRGVMTAALPMSWGPTDELIELTGEELLNGASLPKIGCTAFDTEESLPYRLALSHCYKALFFRLDRGGDQATVEVAEGVHAFAKYPGSTGNEISFSITGEDDAYSVKIFFKGELKETHVVTTPVELRDIESSWITFTVSTAEVEEIPETGEVVKLEGGTNGSISSTSFEKYLDAIDGATWQCMAIEGYREEYNPQIISKIKSLRDDRGKKVQAVLFEASSADYEGIISVHQGFKTPVDTVAPNLFPLWVASITAGAAINQSNTAMVVPDAYEIIDAISDTDIAQYLAQGKFLLSYRQDGAVVVEQDINSLHTFTPEKGYAFSKNRVVRCLDEIGNTASLIFARNYAGKVSNNDVGRNVYKMELISLMDQMQNVGAIQNFNGSSDITVLPGQSVDSVLVELTIQPVDSMEKIYMTVNVDA